MMDSLVTIVLSALTGALLSAGGALLQRERATRLGVQALLRAQIVHMVNQYLPLRCMPIYERENLDELYKQYSNLGGNGAISPLVRQLMALPPSLEKGEMDGDCQFSQ